MKTKTDVVLGLAGAFVLLTFGCASVKQEAFTKVTSSYLLDERGKTNSITVVEEKKTSNDITASGEAKQTIEKITASNGKTHSLGAKGVDNESNNSPTEFMKALAELLKAVKTP